MKLFASQEVADMDHTMSARQNAVRAARQAAARGNPICGMLAAMELEAEPFYLGLDADEDDSDLDVWP